MKCYIVREHYYQEGFNILNIYSDEDNAKLDVSILKGLKEVYDSCHYDNPHRKTMQNRIESMGASSYCTSWDYIEKEIK